MLLVKHDILQLLFIVTTEGSAVIDLFKRLAGAGSKPLPLEDRGAITVEYALCMVIAASIMLGIFSMFEDMSVRIINEFKYYVLSFPNT